MLQSFGEELKKLGKDKLMWVVCIIMPICINLMMGWEFSCGVISHVPIAIVDQDHSQLSRKIIGYFKNNEAFSVDYEVETQKELEQLLDTSKVRAGMIIPENFSQDVTDLKAPVILMLYDGSHMSMVSIAKAKASEILLTARVGASVQQLEARYNQTENEAMTKAMPVSFVYRHLYNPTKSFKDFMLPGYGSIVCQLGIAFTAALSVMFPRDDKKLKSAAGYLIGKIMFYGSLGSLAIVINLLVQVYFYKVPCRGPLMLGLAMGILFMFAVASYSVAISACLKNRVFAQAFLGVTLIPNSIFAGYTWPVMSMIPTYQKMAFYFPFTHFGDNIRDLYLKGSMQQPMADVKFYMMYIVGMLLIGMIGIYAGKLGKEKEPDMR